MKSATRLISLLLAGLLAACSTTSHPVQSAALGKPASAAAMEAALATPGPVELQTVASADWVVPLSGLLNLKDPQAVAAGLADRPEPIQVYLHVLRHPKFGVFLVDTGVSAQLLKTPSKFGISSELQQMLNIPRLQLRRDAESVVAELGGQVRGVFLTHLHLDHITGLPALARDVPIHAGPGELAEQHAMPDMMRAATDALLAGRPAQHEWPFAAGRDGVPAGVIDVFADGSVFAIAAPGHTTGSTAYLVRTLQGPVLLTGDVSHTRWGWEHGVEPGDYTRDQLLNRSSLQQLKALVARHPAIEVRLGHQP
ncbi:MBL fold metallo-hydrolase [Chitinilyticum litopenaei]|uniref:MBL fold metallo-hydrolase n=1 Tax=Chitinilyticum litopenaei TaxID=1121276 RepID=UPI000420F42D|nr:MBL fold metallo-hydrolase [Chitinilyticum litopenaei]